MRNRIGIVLMAIAVLHEIVGLFFYWDALVDILGAGFFNTVNPPHWERDAAFWFLMFGVTLFLMGWIAQWMLENTGTIPKFYGWGLLALCVVGVMMMPATGFWLVIPVAIMMIRLPEASTNEFMLSS